MVGSNRRVVTLKKLQEGHYVFKLTVTDQKGLSGHDEVAVNVKKGEQNFISRYHCCRVGAGITQSVSTRLEGPLRR